MLAGHEVQNACPVELLYLPAGQSMHEANVLPTMLLNLPAGHETHSAEGGSVPYAPAGQVVQFADDMDPSLEK